MNTGLVQTPSSASATSEYFMKVLFEVSNILKLVYDCIKIKLNYLNILTCNATPGVTLQIGCLRITKPATGLNSNFWLGATRRKTQ